MLFCAVVTFLTTRIWHQAHCVAPTYFIDAVGRGVLAAPRYSRKAHSRVGSNGDRSLSSRDAFNSITGNNDAKVALPRVEFETFRVASRVSASGSSPMT